MGLKQWIKNLDEFDIMNLIIIVLTVAIILLAALLITGIMTERSNNEAEMGKFISDNEKECFNICGKDNYFFTSGGLFSSDQCTCGVK